MFNYVCEFEVEGGGDFPFDMLRYDRCSPFTSEDAASIGLDPWEAREDTRKIRLVRFTEGYGKNYNDNPTVRRWASFGWKVTKVEFRNLKTNRTYPGKL